MSKELYRQEILTLWGEDNSKSGITKFLIKKYELPDAFDKVRKWVRSAIGESSAPVKEAIPKATIKTSEAMPFVMSAWNQATGLVMDIDEYCKHYNLPKEDVVEFRLISHTGTPFYNVRFKENVNSIGELTEEIVYSVIQKHIQPVNITYTKPSHVSSEWFDRAVYTDCHNGMETNKDGIAMYATKWDLVEQLSRIEILAQTILSNQKGTVLRLDDLGDFQDGWDAQTVRGGHSLPQNKSNGDSFDDGVFIKVHLVDLLAPYYETIYMDNICNDNHAGSFGYVTNSAVKNILELKYSHVKVTNHLRFINHYYMGKHAFVITHGKDAKNLKFGFKPKLDPIQVDKIDAYLKHFSVYQSASFIEFSKGDSHQMLLDYCTSDDFTYFNYPAFSPSSEWVQTNFRKGRSGFVVQNIRYNDNVKHILPFFF